MTPLWAAADAVRATRGCGPTGWTAAGVSIDTRTLAAGDLFVALHGPNHDGHDFVAAAFERGAAAAMVDRPVAGLPAAGAPLLRVGDTLAALAALGEFARARSPARIVAITGSVGKTGTKEALRAALGACGTAFASAGSLNNHWGVPLSLARMPPEAGFGIFELGMNHAGEIAALTRLVRPHIAVITTVAPAHLGFFASVEAIAEAKAEIFRGLEPGGVGVLNRDNPHYPRLAKAAERAGAEVIGFGADREARVRLIDRIADGRGSTVEAAIDGANLRFRLPAPGRHWAMNALAVLGAALAVGCDLQCAAAALGRVEPLPGRGRRHELAWQGGTLSLIDESYNASPASMEAALAVLGDAIPADGGRRVAVLGDMLELGDAAERLHRELAGPIAAAAVDRVFLVGGAVAALDEMLPAATRGGLWQCAEEAIPALVSFLQPGDVVTVKGSYAVHIDRIVERLFAEAARAER
jgi:UDP-N-acetylmuramoyl-tripeptide--D-alanyl-D-alanine ligase